MLPGHRLQVSVYLQGQVRLRNLSGSRARAVGGELKTVVFVGGGPWYWSRHGAPWAGAIGGVIGEDGDAVSAWDRAIAVIHHLSHKQDGSVGGDRGRRRDFCPPVGGVTPAPTIGRYAVEDGAGSETAQLIANRFRLAVW